MSFPAACGWLVAKVQNSEQANQNEYKKTGSCVLIGPKRILTCAHTLFEQDRMDLKPGDTVDVFFTKDKLGRPAVIRKVDKEIDLALLELSEPSYDITPLVIHSKIIDSEIDNAKRAREVEVYGFPEYKQDREDIVQASLRMIKGTNPNKQPATELHLTIPDRSTRLHGLSGGPVCLDGQIIGIFTSVQESHLGGPQNGLGYMCRQTDLHRFVDKPCVGPPVNVSYDVKFYVNRTKQQNQALFSLHNSGGALIVIHGNRGIGKTWLLYWLSNQIRNEYLVVYCKIERPNTGMRLDEKTIIELLFENIMDAIPDKGRIVKKRYKSSLESLSKETATDLSDFLKNLLEAEVIKKIEKMKKSGIVLMIDHASLLIEYKLYDWFMSMLDGWKNKASLNPKWKLINTISNFWEPLPSETNRDQSLRRVTNIIELPKFDSSQTKQLALQYMYTVSDDKVTELLEKSGGCPVKLRAILSDS